MGHTNICNEVRKYLQEHQHLQNGDVFMGGAKLFCWLSERFLGPPRFVPTTCPPFLRWVLEHLTPPTPHACEGTYPGEDHGGILAQTPPT